MKRITDNVGNNDDRNSQPDHMDPGFLSRPISYHPGVSDGFDGWAASCGFQPEALRQLTESRIRNHHPEAIPEDARFKDRPDSAAIFRLSLGMADVFYSIEVNEIVVRGYGWEIVGEPVDDYDGGGYYVN